MFDTKKVLLGLVSLIVVSMCIYIYMVYLVSPSDIKTNTPITLTLEKYEVAALLESNNFGLLNKQTSQIDYIVKDSLLQIIYVFYAAKHQDAYIKSINKK